MLKVDEFESAFRAADKKAFHLDPPEVKRALVVTDLGHETAKGSPFAGGPEDEAAFVDATKSLLTVLGDVEISALHGGDYDTMEQLLNSVMEQKPDLIVSYRNLRDGLWRWGYSLGSVLDVLTRETPEPVLIVPNPHEFPELEFKSSRTDSVMVVTDHLAGDDTLTNWGVKLTRDKGRLWLAHVEDDVVFDRYMEIIGKLGSIDTDEARKDILAQLLKEPHDYILRIGEALEEAELPIVIGEIVTSGHRVKDFVRLTEEHDVDLLCFHTRDQGQVAMHGAAYALAVELRELPMLLI